MSFFDHLLAAHAWDGKPNDEAKDIIKESEGWRETTYRCPANVPTIGWGSTRTNKGERVTMSHPKINKKTGESYLQFELQHVEHAIRRLLPVELTANQFSAVSSWTYNLGSGALQRSTLRQCILRGEIEEAADQMLRWVYAAGRKLPGLVTRRHKERLLFLT